MVAKEQFVSRRVFRWKVYLFGAAFLSPRQNDLPGSLPHRRARARQSKQSGKLGLLEVIFALIDVAGEAEKSFRHIGSFFCYSQLG